MEWLHELDDESHVSVIAALELLQERGPALGRPLVDTVRDSKHKNMKELRPGSAGKSELRVLFAFDPRRIAVLLVAGDKSGTWDRWYRDNIPVADELFDNHLARLQEEGGEKK
ncbi:diaminopimelate decarboxylase [Mycobacterium simiae]|uniref:Diaminopimelate decarboxylase n=1 Tax=Mycobacterium simiae TaxID=1784 RepID=A0A5B1B4Y3_MYCSI|nr:type II toxin-antitoxin system RelE/ParE family toxin [Mycobacterium simiae]KAA1242941.1 diaminopimelate decarboxylase [Mycobacterium simiae]